MQTIDNQSNQVADLTRIYPLQSKLRVEELLRNKTTSILVEGHHLDKLFNW
jgi:hypothetical protein